ncbi:kinase-like domain-containing protein [Dipodascopsis tothii]|uniref:kinase-like domain-containing protein n=1 Tax=Dipodascopsis tothii TaxID=44089 RepID=UPI0034CDCCE4
MDEAAAQNNATRSKYTKERKVGEGTFAVVYVGRQVTTGRQIAIKKIKVGQFKDGLDMSAIREVKFLQEMKHDNVIELVDVFSSKTNLNLVLEYLSADLEMIIRDRSLIFSSSDVKSWLLMTLRGLHHCHRHSILHRDLKPNNLLLSPSGHLKLADFGLARQIPGPYDPMTPTVVTRWYRAPELLLGARHYTAAIDVWSVGIIFAELMLRTPYLPGQSDLDQLDVTFRALGTPTEDSWPGVTSLPDYFLGKQDPGAGGNGQKPSPYHYPAPTRDELRGRFSAASEGALDLMCQMIVLDPAKRVDTAGALRAGYFAELPRPTKPELLPKLSETKADAPANGTDGHGQPKQLKRGIHAQALDSLTAVNHAGRAKPGEIKRIRVVGVNDAATVQGVHSVARKLQF